MHIVGTAGHVDHGKSSLVRALTGTDPDRWIEERLRGMTLDLGFAHLRFPDGVEAGIVDVPGHERFLHNMLAGAAGMELLLLVVAANEGPKPQTLEHLAILDYLRARACIIVLTKRDLVDDEELTYADAFVRDAVRGTFAERAPVLAVSTLTGAGLDDLRAAIHAALTALPPRALQAPAFLPVDRVFALSGHGTIVTGTLMQGRIAAGDQLVLQPSGKPVRVRSLQVFGAKRPSADGGTRVAANIPGVDTGEIARGEVLAAPEFVPQAAFRVTFTPRPGVPALLRRRMPVRAYLGAAEIIGTLVFDPLPAERETVAALLHLRRPAVVFPGEAYVVRRLSPKTLLGGGLLDAAPGAAALPDAGDAPEAAAVLGALRAWAPASRTVAQIAAAANVREERALAILDDAAVMGRVRRLLKPVEYLDADAARALFERIAALLAQREERQPWLLGTTSLAIARALERDEPFVLRLLASFVDDGLLTMRAGYYATPGFVPSLSAEQRAFFERAIPVDPAQPLVPASLEALTGDVRRTKDAALSGALDTLVATGALVKVGDAVYRGTQIDEIRGRLVAHLRREKGITPATFRDVIGTSRKYAVPLLEWFDNTGVTLRNGDLRILRTRPSSSPKSD